MKVGWEMPVAFIVATAAALKLDVATEALLDVKDTGAAEPYSDGDEVAPDRLAVEIVFTADAGDAIGLTVVEAVAVPLAIDAEVERLDTLTLMLGVDDTARVEEATPVAEKVPLPYGAPVKFERTGTLRLGTEVVPDEPLKKVETTVRLGVATIAVDSLDDEALDMGEGAPVEI